MTTVDRIGARGEDGKYVPVGRVCLFGRTPKLVFDVDLTPGTHCHFKASSEESMDIDFTGPVMDGEMLIGEVYMSEHADRLRGDESHYSWNINIISSPKAGKWYKISQE